jgi:hypothetical protein
MKAHLNFLVIFKIFLENTSKHYVNCLNKDSIELIPKKQGFDEAAEIIIDRIEIATIGTVGSGFDWLFGNLLKNKKFYNSNNSHYNILILLLQ